MRAVVRTLVVLLALATGLTLASTAEATTVTPPVVGWESVLPGLPTNANPQFHGVPGCRHARMSCLDVEVSRMDRLRRSLGCDHRAVFTTTYELLTIALRKRMRADPHLFRDPAWVIAEDATFANMYFHSVAADAAGRPVPKAWQIAFHTAERGNANALQDMVLGINAHVQRDMPFMMAAVGLHTRAGASHKHDHDVMNAVLNTAFPKVVDAIAARFDPMANLIAPRFNTALGLTGNVAGDQLVQAWREVVWRNAELLLDTAGTPSQRLVADTIETHAALWAHTIADLPQYPRYRIIRDRYCATHNTRSLPGA